MKVQLVNITALLTAFIFLIEVEFSTCYHILQEPDVILCEPQEDREGHGRDGDDENDGGYYEQNYIYINCTELSYEGGGEHIAQLNNKRYQNFYIKLWLIQFGMLSFMFLVMILTIMCHVYLGNRLYSFLCKISRCFIITRYIQYICCYCCFGRRCRHHSRFCWCPLNHRYRGRHSDFDLFGEEELMQYGEKNSHYGGNYDDYEDDDDGEDDTYGLPILSNIRNHNGVGDITGRMSFNKASKSKFVFSGVANASKYIDNLFN